MLRDSLILLYCAAVGFVAAGLAASLYRMIAKEAPRFRMLGEGWLAAVTTFLFCALTGPAIMVDMVANIFRERGAPGTALAGLAVATLWSVCSGILVLHIVLSVGRGLA